MMEPAAQLPRTVLLAAVVAFAAFVGCSEESHRNALSPTAPTVGAAVDGNLARISLPFDPTRFVAGVDNPYFPLVPGTVYHYEEETEDGLETNTVEVTHDTKNILGVTTVVVHDRVYLEGDLTEDTFDWYAQDVDGNVWYLGEDTREYENGQVVSTEGSWEAGQSNAAAGIIMLARPKIGDQYYQENAPGVVEDQGKVVALNETVETPYGTFTGCVKTQEWTPIEPGNRAFKFYAPGVGCVMELMPRGGRGTLELTDLDRP